MDDGEQVKIAVASSDGIVVNQHFGKAAQFIIGIVNPENYGFKKLEIRQSKLVCQGGVHTELELKRRVSELSDCKYILVSRIGRQAQIILEQAGIEVYEIPDLIENAVERMMKYQKIQMMLSGVS